MRTCDVGFCTETLLLLCSLKIKICCSTMMWFPRIFIIRLVFMLLKECNYLDTLMVLRFGLMVSRIVYRMCNMKRNISNIISCLFHAVSSFNFECTLSQKKKFFLIKPCIVPASLNCQRITREYDFYLTKCGLNFG